MAQKDHKNVLTNLKRLKNHTKYHFQAQWNKTTRKFKYMKTKQYILEEPMVRCSQREFFKIPKINKNENIPKLTKCRKAALRCL